jgi:hypothetical protein
MFIATGPHPRISLLIRSRIRQPTIADAGKGGCAPTELGDQKKERAINISPRMGRSSAMFCCTSKLNQPRFT